jgi:hypothetical protein
MDDEIIDEENKFNIDDSLLEYYNLKNRYEKDHYNKYIKPIVLGNYSKLTKRQKFQELKKPLCINCKQPVGTIFERKYYKEYNNKTNVIIFTAKCGNILSPCELNIEIHKSLRETYDKLIKEYDEELNKYKMEIIKLKNKILFLGKNNVNENKYIEEFNKYKDAIVYYSNTIGEYTEENIIINDNPEKNEKLKNLITSLNQFEIMQFKDYIKKYMDDNDDNMLNNAINMYITEIMPKLKEIRELKYKIMYVHHDEDKNKILIQSKYSPEEMNFYDKDVDEVVRFIKGIKVGEITKNKLKISETREKSKSKSMTLKNTGKTLKTKTKKRILKIEKEIFEEPEESEQSEELEVDVEFEIPKEKSEKEKELEEESEEEINVDVVFESNNEEDKITFVAEPIKSDNIKSLKFSSVPKKIGEKIVLNEATEALEK